MTFELMNDTIKTLEANGWREYPNQFKKYSRCFYKRMDTPCRCHCNDDKAGIQVQMSVGNFDGNESLELEIVAGLQDETWVTLHNYALPKDVNQALALVPRLVALWEAASRSASNA